MTEVVLFHHVLGLTDGVAALAEEFSSAGHLVHTPDLFDGERFASIDEGLAHVESIGFSTLIERGSTFVESLPDRLTFAGVSLGVLPAQFLAQTRPGAAAALLLEACVPVTEFSERWPDDVWLQVHGMADDRFFAGEGDLEAASSIVDSVADAGVAELFVYPGEDHLFVDRSLPSFDAGATRLVVERALDLLSRIDNRANR